MFDFIGTDGMNIFNPLIKGFKPLPKGHVLLKRYRIEDLIKVGGMGAIYRVLDTRLGRLLALKQMLVKFKSRHERQIQVDNFISEIQILKTLRHPNIPRFFDAFVENDSFFFVMEYIQGMDMVSLLRKSYPNGAPESLVVSWAMQVANALEYLHNLKPPVVHRDIKPHNIMVHKRSNLIKLIDFGISRPRTKEYVFGTPGYCPPEQFEDPYRIDPSDDIYSTAMTLIFMLTLKHPPEDYSLTPEEMLEGIRVSEKLKRIISKAGSPDDSKRYRNGAEFKRDLEEAFPYAKEEILKLYSGLRAQEKRLSRYKDILADKLLAFLREVYQMKPSFITLTNDPLVPLKELGITKQDIMDRDYLEIPIGSYEQHSLILKFKTDKLDLMLKPKLFPAEPIAQISFEGLDEGEFKTRLSEALRNLSEKLLSYEG